MLRMFLAFIVTAILYAALAAAFGRDPAGAIVAGTLLIFLVNVVIGTPLVLFLRKMNWLQSWHFASCGALVGIVAATLIWLGIEKWEAIFSAFMLGAVHGALIWLIGAFRNSELLMTGRGYQDSNRDA